MLASYLVGSRDARGLSPWIWRLEVREASVREEVGEMVAPFSTSKNLPL